MTPRSKIITFRVSEEEFLLIKSKAALEGLRISDFARKKLLEVLA